MQRAGKVTDRPIDRPSPKNTLDRELAPAVREISFHLAIENGLLPEQTQSVPGVARAWIQMKCSRGAGDLLRLEG